MPGMSHRDKQKRRPSIEGGRFVQSLLYDFDLIFFVHLEKCAFGAPIGK